jgi:hypothetical protein
MRGDALPTAAFHRYASLIFLSSFYHAQTDHARRLADLTIQPNVEEILRRVAEELDRLADDAASGEAVFRDPDKPESR